MTYDELKKLVTYHNKLYYDYNLPELTDKQYDLLYDSLVELEKQQGWRDIDSPTIRVGGSKGKVKHPVKLYSLNKVYSKEEIGKEFDVQTPKLDGANLTLIYKKNKISIALTRGNGEFGENVTHLLPGIAGIPKNVNMDLIVNGECVTDNKVENFRNYVSGALGLLDLNEFKSRNIRFIAHDILGMNINYLSKMKILEGNNFHTVMDIDLCNHYPQDGLVFRINDWKTCSRLGYTAKHPRFAIALKERESLTAITTLKDVVWIVGRTGTVNPTGIVEPVELDGAIISRVTLHNLEYIENHDLGLGDLIQIERAGGVIPKFNRVIQHAKHNFKIKQRHAEEALGYALRKVGPKLFVTDSSQYSTSKFLEHFIKTLEIRGLGPSSISKMQLKHPIDIYKVTDWSILGANGDKIQEEVNRSKTKPYNMVLAALGIPGIGKTVAKQIVQYIPLFNKLRDIETIQINGIGPKTIENLLSWLDENESWVYELPLQLSVDQSIDLDLNSSEVKKVCITGKLDMTRNDLSEILTNKGYTVTTTVTKDCYALITAGDNTSSKYKKAVDNNIKIIDYWSNKNNIIAGIF